jgi:hypothetical protein
MQKNDGEYITQWQCVVCDQIHIVFKEIIMCRFCFAKFCKEERWIGSECNDCDTSCCCLFCHKVDNENGYFCRLCVAWNCGCIPRDIHDCKQGKISDQKRMLRYISQHIIIHLADIVVSYCLKIQTLQSFFPHLDDEQVTHFKSILDSAAYIN